MTGQNIFDTASAYLSTTSADNSELAGFALLWLNSLIAEAYPYEQQYRRTIASNAGVTPTLLTAIPLLTTLNDTVPYCDEITRIALPYGLASNLFTEDEQASWAVEYRNRYISALNEAATATQEFITDYYTETEE